MRAFATEIVLWVGIAAVSACDSPASKDQQELAAEFTSASQILFGALLRGDTATVRQISADSGAAQHMLALRSTASDVFADAERGVTLQDSPFQVSADTVYLVYLPNGRLLPRDILGVGLVRRGDGWLFYHLGFQEHRRSRSPT